MTQIVLFGIGKIAEVVFSFLADDPSVTVSGFTCDRAFRKADTFHGLPVAAFDEVETVFDPASHAMIVAIGYHDLNRLRAARCAEARAKGYRLASWVSPAAHVPSSCRIGENCLVMPGASLQPHASIGDDVFVWNNAVVGHHASVAAHGWIASNATLSSEVRMESFCFVGVNAAIGHNLSVGEANLIGAGAILTRDTPPSSVYIAAETPRFRLDSDRFMRIARLV